MTQVVVLDDGRAVTGFVTNEEADALTLHGSESRETRIEKARIESRAEQSISVMPEKLADDLTVAEFASLLDYLESLKGG